MKFSNKFLLTVLFSLFFSGIYAESFRVRKLIPVDIIPSPEQEHILYSGINDSLALYFPEDKTYLEGVEVKLTIPATIAEWRDAVVFSIYDNISPKPVSSQIDYSGAKIFATPVPTKLSWNILIPITDQNSIKSGSYNTTKINVIPDISKEYTFLRFQPAMKGIPEETENAEFKITVKPILINKGKLLINLKTYDDSQNPYTIYIDEIPYSSAKKVYLLETGMHTLNIQSEFYRNETRSVYIEQAKETAVDIKLQSLEPTITVSAPANASIFLDSNKIEVNSKNLVISEGEHTIKCQLGDYELFRKITVEKGKSYSVNLAVDLQVNEE